MRTKEGINLKLVHDKTGRLVCDPYNDENLRKMAAELKIKMCWYEKDYFKIPPFRFEEIAKESSLKPEKFVTQFINKHK